MFSKVASKTKRLATTIEKRIESYGKVKYFCIGRNKTGTTSLKAAFEMLSYPVGNQRTPYAST